jgi:hypothetical protein
MNATRKVTARWHIMSHITHHTSHITHQIARTGRSSRRNCAEKTQTSCSYDWVSAIHRCLYMLVFTTFPRTTTKLRTIKHQTHKTTSTINTATISDLTKPISAPPLHRYHHIVPYRPSGNTCAQVDCVSDIFHVFCLRSYCGVSDPLPLPRG